MLLVLKGQLMTPLIVKENQFYPEGCKVIIRQPKRRYYTKIATTKPMYPYAFQSLLGELKVMYEGKSRTQLIAKLHELLAIVSIGRFQSEGLGKVKWLSGEIKSNTMLFNPPTQKRLKIHQCLPHSLPSTIQDLIRYGLLHDFFTTTKHHSKIYYEPKLPDEAFSNLLRCHHATSDHPLIQQFQPYDHLASLITRKHRSPTLSRYKWPSTTKIDFEELAQAISHVSSNVWKFYEFILHNSDLDNINESLEYGHNSLKTHSIVIANLIVNDWEQSNNDSIFTER